MGSMYRGFLISLLLLSLVLVLVIVRPFLHTIILAILLAGLSHPLQDYFVRRLGNRRSLAAVIVTAIDFGLIIIPIGLFVGFVTARAVTTMNSLVEWVRQGGLDTLLADPRLTSFQATLDRWGVDVSQSALQNDAAELSKSLGQYAFSYGAIFVGNIFETLVNFFIMVFILFYFNRDGREMIRMVRGLVPLRAEQEERILEKIEAVNRSVVYGGFLTALCQGVAGGIGMAIAGIPPFFWGAVMAMASFLPAIGSAFVWLPMTGYLVISGRWKMGVFFALWCLVVVGTIDNFLRPFFMRGKGNLNPFYIFVSLVGGVAYFGMKGIIYGPLILSFAAVMLSLYQREYAGVLAESEHGNITRLPDK
jgi:predicted PurR-regulated permease PerM